MCRWCPGTDFFEALEHAIRDSYPKPKMLIVNFPSNPTTQCVDLAFFERLVAIAREHHIYVVHDLAYADIVFDGYRAPSIMEVPGAREIAVEFFTMSKSYNMAGWRVGFMVGNRELVTALARMKSYHDYGTFTPIQVASIVALEGPAGLCRDGAQGVPETPRCAVSGTEGAQVGRRDAESDDVRLGADSRAVPRAGLARVLEEAAGGSAYRGRARHRLRPLWRQPRAVCVDRK